MKKSKVREYLREIIIQEQTGEGAAGEKSAGEEIAEIILKVPKKALVNVLKKGLGNLKTSAKMGLFYAQSDNFSDLKKYMAEKMKGKNQRFKTEEEVLKYIDDNSDELIQYAVEHYNENHPDDDPVKLEHIRR